MHCDLEGKVAVVFGAGSCGDGWSNGKAAAVVYARSGARVVAVDINAAEAESTRSVIAEEGGECIAVCADVTDNEMVQSAVQNSMDQFGRIDILHNNVGINRPGNPVTMTEQDWDRSIDCNLKSVFLTCKHVIPIMEQQRSGVITNISSINSIRIPEYDQIAYYASKAAVNHITRGIAVKYADVGIRANSILPGLIHTPLLYANEEVVIKVHGSVENMVRERDAASPTGKMGQPWDVANLAVFLASDAAAYISGTEIPVDAGLACKQFR